MASDGSAGAISGANAVLISQASEQARFQPTSGKTLPQSGNGASPVTASIAGSTANPPQSGRAVTSAGSTSVGSSSANSSQVKSAAASSTDPQALVNQINKYLNDSGQADQFRLDPDSSSYIQQINPASGAVVAQYAVSEFPALARSIGASGLFIDDTA
jgi:hypothetical protein